MTEITSICKNKKQCQNNSKIIAGSEGFLNRSNKDPDPDQKRPAKMRQVGSDQQRWFEFLRGEPVEDTDPEKGQRIHEDQDQ